MAKQKSDVKGVKNAVATFKRVPVVVQAHLLDATERTALAIRGRARAKVRVRHGYLKDKIDYSISPKTGVAKVGITAGTVATAGEGGSALHSEGATSHTPTKYGFLIEFGHGGPHPAPAFPFMRPSAEEEVQPYLDRCRQAGADAEKELAERGTGD